MRDRLAEAYTGRSTVRRPEQHRWPRRPYAQTPGLSVPLLRGWLLVPILLYHTLVAAGSVAQSFAASPCNVCSIGYDLLFEAHLLVGVGYHLVPFRAAELLLWRADRVLILVANASMLVACLWRANATVHSASVVALGAVAAMAPFARRDRVNVAANLLIPIVGATELARWHAGIRSAQPSVELVGVMWHASANLCAMVCVGALYVAELAGWRRLPTTIIGWHDLFHCGISAVYWHRLNYVQPGVFGALSAAGQHHDE